MSFFNDATELAAEFIKEPIRSGPFRNVNFVTNEIISRGVFHKYVYLEVSYGKLINELVGLTFESAFEIPESWSNCFSSIKEARSHLNKVMEECLQKN